MSHIQGTEDTAARAWQVLADSARDLTPPDPFVDRMRVTLDRYQRQLDDVQRILEEDRR